MKLVIIPYISSAAQGDELRFSIAGWRRHFAEDDMTLVVVGDYDQAASAADLFIPCQRLSPVLCEYLPPLDVINKILKVRTFFSKAEDFVLAYDDIYAVNDFTLDDIKRPMLNSARPMQYTNAKNGWPMAKDRTIEALEGKGLVCWNWSTHLPKHYEWDKFENIVETYNLRNKGLLRENIYYNTYFQEQAKEAIVLNNATDNIRFGIWSSNYTPSEYKSMAQRKKWFVNAVDGWNLYLRDFLNEHYKLS